MKNEFYCGRKSVNGATHIVLDYYLTEEEPFEGAESFGVRVKERIFEPDGSEFKDEKQLKNVFTARQDADAFMRVIMDGLVTPVELRCVAEDYITAEYSL